MCKNCENILEKNCGKIAEKNVQKLCKKLCKIFEKICVCGKHWKKFVKKIAEKIKKKIVEKSNTSYMLHAG